MPEPHARSITIIGASLAGMHAAQTLRREGFGGTITVIGDEVHDPYDRPPLSKQVLRGEWDSERIGLPAADADLDLEWRLGRRAESLDVGARTITLDGGEVVDFDGLVIATGARARSLPGTEGIAGVHLLRTLDDCVALRRDLDASPDRIAVIGAGFIGAEVAATCRQRGLEVTMIDAAEAPLERGLGAEMGLLVGEIHREHGVDLRLGVGVDHIDGVKRAEAVLLTDGSVVEASVVVVGIGVVPNTEWLEGSGLELDDGVVCDETCLAAPGIVAAGDVARWPSARFGGLVRLEHWENGVQQGEAAARRLLVDDADAEVYDPVPWFWSDQYDRKIQVAGTTAGHDQVQVVVGSSEERRFVALYGRSGTTIAVLGMNRPRHVMQLRTQVADGAPFDEAVAAAGAL